MKLKLKNETRTDEYEKKTLKILGLGSGNRKYSTWIKSSIGRINSTSDITRETVCELEDSIKEFT